MFYLGVGPFLLIPGAQVVGKPPSRRAIHSRRMLTGVPEVIACGSGDGGECEGDRMPRPRLSRPRSAASQRASSHVKNRPASPPLFAAG